MDPFGVIDIPAQMSNLLNSIAKQDFEFGKFLASGEALDSLTPKYHSLFRLRAKNYLDGKYCHDLYLEMGELSHEAAYFCCAFVSVVSGMRGEKYNLKAIREDALRLFVNLQRQPHKHMTENWSTIMSITNTVTAWYNAEF